MKKLSALILFLFPVAAMAAVTNLSMAARGIGISTNGVLYWPTNSAFFTNNGFSPFTWGMVQSNSAASWRAGLGVSEGATNATLLSGSGTSNYLAAFTGSGSLGVSPLYKATNWIGLGTTNPASAFHVRGADGAGSITLDPGGYYTAYQLVMQTQAADEGLVITMGGTKILSAYGYLDADKLSFGTKNNADLVYLNGANVGIGTTGAAAKLAVNGGFHVGGDSDPGDNNAGFDGSVYVGGTIYGNSIYITNEPSHANLYATNKVYGNSIVATNYVGAGILSPVANVHGYQSSSNAVLKLETAATNDDPNWTVYQARFATATNTPASMWSQVLDDNTVYQLTANVTARQANGTANCASYQRIACLKMVSGSTSWVGTQGNIFGVEDDASWDCTWVGSSSNAFLYVTGALTNVVVWHANISIQKLSQ